MSDIRHSLKKLGFPQCVRETLSFIEQLTINHLSRKAPPKSMDFVNEIISEFMFRESIPTSADNNKQIQQMTSIQELQLLNMLCEYFSCRHESDMYLLNTIFLYLFPENSQATRGRVLIKLLSMAVASKNKPVLNAAATWMQQLGSTSRYCLDMARGLIKDYFELVPYDVVEKLKDLSHVASQFTGNLLTAVAELYCNSINNMPPNLLLTLVTCWVTSHPTILLPASTHMQGSSVGSNPLLPFGGIPMPSATPYAGLFRWCVLAPLAEIKMKDNNQSNEQELYSQLHLALMESLLDTRLAPKVNSVSTLHMVRIITTLKAEIALLPNNENITRKSLDRLGQAMLVVLHSNCLYDNRQELFKQMDNLPENRLVTMVAARFRNT